MKAAGLLSGRSVRANCGAQHTWGPQPQKAMGRLGAKGLWVLAAGCKPSTGVASLEKAMTHT